MHKTTQSIGFSYLLFCWLNFVDLSTDATISETKTCLRCKCSHVLSHRRRSIFAVFYSNRWWDSGYETETWHCSLRGVLQHILSNSKKTPGNIYKANIACHWGDAWVKLYTFNYHCVWCEVEMSSCCCGSIKAELGWTKCTCVSKKKCLAAVFSCCVHAQRKWSVLIDNWSQKQLL